MQVAPGPVKADHDLAMAWVDRMKGVYQKVIDKQSRSGQMVPDDLIRARNHLAALAVIERTLREHHEMAEGRTYPGGKTRPVVFDMTAIATLIYPDGTRKEIPRHG